MGLPKKKIGSEKRRQTAAPRSPMEDPASARLLRDQATWEPVLTQFSGRSFASAAEAADALADALIARLGWRPSEELRQFIGLVLESDPVGDELFLRLVRES